MDNNVAPCICSACQFGRAVNFINSLRTFFSKDGISIRLSCPYTSLKTAKTNDSFAQPKTLFVCSSFKQTFHHHFGLKPSIPPPISSIATHPVPLIFLRPTIFSLVSIQHTTISASLAAYAPQTHMPRPSYALQYLTLARLDLSYAVQQVCLFMNDPRDSHFQLIEHILRYIWGSTQLGLQLYQSSTHDLIAYWDADWAGCILANPPLDFVYCWATMSCLGLRNGNILFLALVLRRSIRLPIVLLSHVGFPNF